MVTEDGSLLQGPKKSETVGRLGGLKRENGSFAGPQAQESLFKLHDFALCIAQAVAIECTALFPHLRPRDEAARDQFCCAPLKCSVLQPGQGR